MARIKLIVRRLAVTLAFVPVPGQGNKRITRKRKKEFKIKKLLPQLRTIQVKQNGQVIRTMKVHRKRVHFSGNGTLRF